jgi:Response regulator containing CheY-like receiver, AAA-type ATPase, and DNA-binding domains
MVKKLKVIIFDDDEAIRAALSRLVESLGHEVLSFSDPTICPLYSDAMCTCTKGTPCADLLITDNNMPKMTGLEFIRQQVLRGCKGVASNKAIMSGAWSEQDLLVAKSLGCKIFIKPFDVDELLDWIEERAIAISL